MNKMKMERVYIGSDHGGFTMKIKVMQYLQKLGYQPIDVGCDSDNSCDYPDYALKAAGLAAKNNSRAILVCGTGIGMAMAANKVKGARAAVAYDEYTARMSREHNDSNVLCLGERTTSEPKAKKIVKTWMETEFSNDERHRRRVNKIMEIENA